MHLTRTENTILNLLAEGASYLQIANYLKTNTSCIHAHTNNIRRKTGIRNTKDKLECLRFVGRHMPKDLSGPTATQRKVLQMLSHGVRYSEIARKLQISIGTAMNHASQACQRAGITQGQGRRQEAIEQWLRTHPENQILPEGSPLADPMF